MKMYFPLLAILILSLNGYSQDLKKKSTKKLGLIESYYVLESRPKIKHGNYVLMYGKDTIQKGFYSNNMKTGIWTYFRDNNKVEFIYDFDSQCIVSDSIGKERKALFSEGYFYFMNLIGLNIVYPNKAKESSNQGRVVVETTIDENGSPINFNLKLGCGDLSLNKEVMNAIKKVANEYPWFPGINAKGDKIRSTVESSVNYQVK